MVNTELWASTVGGQDAHAYSDMTLVGGSLWAICLARGRCHKFMDGPLGSMQ